MNSVDMENVRKYMAIIHLGGLNQKIEEGRVVMARYFF
jgi:hypothetical protein